MKSNILNAKSKINTHSLKAANFKFLVHVYANENDINPAIVQVPMNDILSEPNGHQGKHFMIYVLDSAEIENKVVVNKEELDSVLSQVKIELGCPTIEMIGVVHE